MCWIKVYVLYPPPQEFVIPWSSCRVSCEAGLEEVWWIKLLSSLTRYTFPQDTSAWWITIGLEEAGRGKEGEDERVRKRDWSSCLDWPLECIQTHFCGTVWYSSCVCRIKRGIRSKCRIKMQFVTFSCKEFLFFLKTKSDFPVHQVDESLLFRTKVSGTFLWLWYILYFIWSNRHEQG